MQTIVGILTFISVINATSGNSKHRLYIVNVGSNVILDPCSKARKNHYCLCHDFTFHELLEFHAQFS